MAEPNTEHATYQDILALPEHLVGEILGGELHTHPRPAPRHARAYSALTGNLWGPFDHGGNGPGGWWILDEPELHLGGDIIVPDLAGWRREHMPSLPDTAWFELAPDWVCEILSPATARTDRAVKMPGYAREGVPHLWLVDPDARTLEVYALQEGAYWLLLATLQEDDAVSQPPFEAITFALDTLWA
ncbi:Uma2 family endonuclease [Arhodomonas sp. SL1]|uniref:Uma2 family endonuclease n=1 Tax=Arhodomonas sp. SL1 TaxID=3425691 RepID=UPI003F8836A9